MQRRFGALVVACACLALPTTAAARTKTVFAGPPPSSEGLAVKTLGKKFLSTFNPVVNAYFQRRVTIHVGESVYFILAGFHDVDLPGSGGKPLPLLTQGNTITVVTDVAGNPFWFNGKLPTLSLNPAVVARSRGTTYNGTARLTSGLPPETGAPTPFKIRFTKAGTYKYFCDIHPGMVGFVVVKPKGAKVPSAKQDAAALNKQLTTDIAGAKKLATSKVPANQVRLGEANANGVELFTMFPSTLRVHTGTVATFSMSPRSFEIHTASFGPLKYLNQLNAALFGPPGPTAQVLYPSDPASPILVDPTSHANGFANTGALDANSGSTQIPQSSKVQFTASGTYNFICLIHPLMHGTVVVTP
jgi:plastocyanin